MKYRRWSATIWRSLLLWGLLLSILSPVRSQNDTGVQVAPPVVVWHFEGAMEPGLSRENLTPSAVGPRAPRYPSFRTDNHALALSGATTAITVPDRDFPKGQLRFTNNDSITLEAWVKLRDLKEGTYAYVLGKGRTRQKGFPEKNQNYALRLKGEKGEARVSFLFASTASREHSGDWHRWTTNQGFAPGGGWHHVAVSYTFGKPASIRGYIDGKVIPGTWDMGGATTRAPVSDADDLVIGTGNGGGASNSFSGWLDEVTIWRAALPEAVLTGRYQFVPPPPVVQKEALARGTVLVQLCEDGMPTRNAWPDEPLRATESYHEDVFGFFAVPQKYVDTGVRADRANPYLFRAAARIPLPVGKHRLLLRSRSAGRLYLNGQLILSTPFTPGDGSGHGTVPKPESYLNLGPDFRFAPPGNGEAWTTYHSRGGEHLVVLETIVGGFLGKAKRRPELGETVVAISLEGSESWELLSPGKRRVPYNDSGWAAYEAERTSHLEQIDRNARARARAEHRKYWDKRREVARKWLAETPEIKVPELPTGFPAQNPIDHFVAARIVRVTAQNNEAKRGAVDFFKQIQPLLESRCYDCHAGTRVKGGLRLDNRVNALKGGKFAGPALVPGKPDRSVLLARVQSSEQTEVMPPRGERLSKSQIQLLETWIREGAHWPESNPTRTSLTPLTDDYAFLRRVTLDTVGLVPSLVEIQAFLNDKSPERRARVIDRLLNDPRWADHWMGYWQDVLAENPNILNPTLNNSGPFRWWIYESLLDNKPVDLFVTELVRMRGSQRFGGPAGFGVATQNDVPMAAKGTIVAAAFLGVEMKCARCHDAPSHRSTQADLFQLAALLGQKALTVPVSSSVPLDRIHQGGRKPLINVTLKPGTSVEPKWPFGELVPEALGKDLAEDPNDSRDRLAALITAPQNERFAQVMVNRLWKELMGRGLVEPVDDWERGHSTHPELLRWLGRELIRNNYNMKHVARLILNSHAYQRATDRSLREADGLYAAPAPRRLAAEQIVDSLFMATGKPFQVEEVSLDIDGRRDLGNSISLGKPRRAWMLTSTSNERDRPSLALPRIQAVVDVLQAFGWRGARQEPTSVRDQSPNVLQPAILSNGTMGMWLTRLSDDHGITALALESLPLDEFLDQLFLRMLTRKPSAEEKKLYTEYLRAGYDQRRRSVDPSPKARTKRLPTPYVSWSNHLDPEATLVRQAQEAAARKGEPPTARLESHWRTRLEDVLWALVNSTEFVFVP